MRPRSNDFGFSLVEVMVAMAILSIGLLATFMGLVQAANVSREGQLRQYKSVLIEATLQRVSLVDKSVATLLTSLVGGSSVLATQLPPQIPIGTAPWIIDPSVPNGDLGTGAVFQILPDGEISPVPGTFTSCADSNISVGLYCRELLLEAAPPLPTGAPGMIQANLSNANAGSLVLWIRVSRIGQSPSLAAVERRVLDFRL